MSDPPPYQAFTALLPVLVAERRGMLVSYLVGAASALALAAISVLTAWGVGHAVVERTPPAASWWIALSALVLIRTLLTWQEMDVSHALAYRVLARLRMALFDSYARSVPGRRREHSGRAASVVMGDIEKLEFFYAHTVAQVATAITVFLGALACASALLVEAGIVMLAGSIVVASSAALGARAVRDLGCREQHARTAMSVGIADALGALREVLAYGLVARVVGDALDVTDRATSIGRRREMLTQLVTAIREITVTAVVIGVIVTSAHAAGILANGLEPRFSPAVLPALVALALVGVSAVTDVTTTITQLHPLVTSARRVVDGIHQPAVVTPPATPQPVPAGPLGLRFHEVSFSYDDATPALADWTADIEPGEHVALSGPSGSGKSTLVALTARLWDPVSGTISVVDTSGRLVPLSLLEDGALRGAIAMIDQDTTLFHGTVRDNLNRGADPSSDEHLQAVLHRVGADEWISLDADLGQGGLRLSGGQQARLCLARALARRPRILLIDEVTASLDSETEQVISDVIADFVGTVLIVSHRAETLRRVDRIVRVEPPSRSRSATSVPARS